MEESPKQQQERNVLFNAVRAWLQEHVDQGTSIILKIQSYRNPLFDFYFKLATFLGDKLFYMTLLPCLLWLDKGETSFADIELGRSVTLLVALGVLIGNFFKELFALPRPPSPPVWLGKKEHDYGLPSNHSIASVGVNLFLIAFWNAKGLLHLDFGTIFCISLWIFSICFSRMYLGVHSHVDVTVGCMLGLILAILWTSSISTVERLLTESPSTEVQFMFPACIAFFLLLHPRSGSTPSYARSITMSGTLIGIVVGAWFEHAASFQRYDWLTRWLVHISQSPIRGSIQSLRQSALWSYFPPYVWKVLLRLVIGFTVANVTLIGVLAATKFIFHFVFSESRETRKRNSPAVMMAKLITSTVTVFVISHSIPQLLKEVATNFSN